MSEPINISLPPSVDDFDLAIDTGWEYLRSYENVNRVFYTASALGDFSLIWHMLNLARRINNPERRGSVLELSLLLGAESLLVNQGLKGSSGEVDPTWVREPTRIKSGNLKRLVFLVATQFSGSCSINTFERQ